MGPIDLRSDTVTKPTEAMQEAMRGAELGDDGREGDPTVRKLEALAASKLGKQAALYLPSGTMANLCSLLTHTSRGSEVLLETLLDLYQELRSRGLGRARQFSPRSE